MTTRRPVEGINPWWESAWGALLARRHQSERSERALSNTTRSGQRFGLLGPLPGHARQEWRRRLPLRRIAGIDRCLVDSVWSHREDGPLVAGGREPRGRGRPQPEAAQLGHRSRAIHPAGRRRAAARDCPDSMEPVPLVARAGGRGGRSLALPVRDGKPRDDSSLPGYVFKLPSVLVHGSPELASAARVARLRAPHEEHLVLAHSLGNPCAGGFVMRRWRQARTAVVGWERL